MAGTVLRFWFGWVSTLWILAIYAAVCVLDVTTTRFAAARQVVEP